jgi:hypothetical protein
MFFYPKFEINLGIFLSLCCFPFNAIRHVF